MHLLNNGLYYNRTNGTCYSGNSNAIIACDFNETGLLEESKSLIDTITWNIGSDGGQSNININHFYNLERSNSTGKICSSGEYCNDSVERTTSWLGQIGLIYPNDYGYAVGGSTVEERSGCLNTNSFENACVINNWLNKTQLTLTPHAYTILSGAGFKIIRNVCTMYEGFISTGSIDNVFPTLYLNSNVRIIGGNGTIDTPYELSL